LSTAKAAGFASDASSGSDPEGLNRTSIGTTYTLVKVSN
jgi:hypothetical protein